MISYARLWKILIDKDMTKMQLKQDTGIGSTTLQKLIHNEPVSMQVIVKICLLLECNVGDIMDIGATK